LNRARELYEEILGEPTDGELSRAQTLVKLGRVLLLLDHTNAAANGPLAAARAIYDRELGEQTSMPIEVRRARLACAHWSARAAAATLDSELTRNQRRRVLVFAGDLAGLDESELPLVAEAAMALAPYAGDSAVSLHEGLFPMAVAIYDQLGAQGDARRRLQAIEAVSAHALWLISKGRPEAAGLREAEFRTRLAAVDPGNEDELSIRDARARVASIDGQILWLTEREQAALERLRAARDLHTALLDSDPDPTSRVREITEIDRCIVDCLAVYGMIDKASAQMAQSVSWVRDRLGDSPGDPRLVQILARSLQTHASVEVMRGELTGTLDSTVTEALLDEA